MCESCESVQKIYIQIYIRGQKRQSDKVADVNKCHSARETECVKKERKPSNKVTFDTQLRREIKRKFLWGIWD